MYNMAFQEAVPVSSDGMVCSISLLFLMLCLVFFSILIFKWRMTKGMGASMFLFYFLFVGFTLGMEYEFYSCPLWNITSTVLLFNFMHAILHTYLNFTLFENLIRPTIWNSARFLNCYLSVIFVITEQIKNLTWPLIYQKFMRKRNHCTVMFVIIQPRITLTCMNTSNQDTSVILDMHVTSVQSFALQGTLWEIIKPDYINKQNKRSIILITRNEFANNQSRR